VSCIICGKSDVERVTSVASYHPGILPIPKAPDVNVPAGGFLYEALAYQGRYQPEKDNSCQINYYSFDHLIIE
jgi:hypothetical protein